MELIVVRHGQTPGNAQKRYVGALDQPLSDKGRQEAREAGVFDNVELVYVSFMQRAKQTAAIMFPNARQVEVRGVEEMDFGVFAGRSADEMVDDPEYRAWVDSYCLAQCPGGEARDQFTKRVCDALERLLREADARGEQRVILVAHGGTMMASLGTFGDGSREYYEWLVGNCESYRIDVDLSGEKPAFTVLESGHLDFS